MASWISHLILVDQLYAMGLDLDERGFAVGNIAPDCNVENEDWTQFTPSREVTHWMKGKSKLTTDYEGFLDEYIRDKTFRSKEHEAFLWGYYSHLVTDVEYQRLIRDEERVKNVYRRLKQNEEMYAKIKGFPEDFDTLKKVFGRQNFFRDISTQEAAYLERMPNSRYNTIIKRTHDFPDYIDYLPSGAIVRKIGIMAKEDSPVPGLDRYVFFSQDEFDGFVEDTSDLIYKLMKEKRYTA